MSIITENPHMWFVCKNSKGKTQTVYNNEHYKHNYPFSFTVNFADVASPQENTVTLYNLTKEHRNFYHEKQYCYVAFDWGTHRKILAEGFIKTIGKPSSDGVTESFQLTFTEGTSYANIEARTLKVTKTSKSHQYVTKKIWIPGKNVTKYRHVTETQVYKRGPKKGQKHEVHHRIPYTVYQKGHYQHKRVKTRVTKTRKVNRTFRKGTDYKSLIKGIARQSGIKISKIDLAKNPKLKRSFTAKGKPLNLLKQVVKKTGSSMTYIRGKLEIINPKRAKRTWFTITDKDLIQPPSSEENDGKRTWEIETPLVPEITTFGGINMKSKYLKGKYYVKAGHHSFDMESAKTQCSLAKI